MEGDSSSERKLGWRWAKGGKGGGPGEMRKGRGYIYLASERSIKIKRLVAGLKSRYNGERRDWVSRIGIKNVAV